MSDLMSDAFYEGHIDYNRGDKIDPASIDRKELGRCRKSPDGRHRLEHSGQVDRTDIMSDPVVRCRYCGRMQRAKWRTDYIEQVTKAIQKAAVEGR